MLAILKYSLILAFGFLLGYYFYVKFKISPGGVLATPFLVLYTLEDPLIFIIFLVAFVASILSIEFFIKQFLIYGRRLFYIALLISLIISALLYITLNPEYSTVFFSIVAGIIAYNSHKELVSGTSYRKITYVWFSEFIIIYIFGFILSFWPNIVKTKNV